LCDATYFLCWDRINLTYQGIINLVTFFLYFSFANFYLLGRVSYFNSAGALKQVFIVSHSYQTWFLGFLGVVPSSLRVAWSRDQEACIIWYQNLAPLIRLYPSINFIFLILFRVKPTCFYPCFCFGSILSSPQCLLTFFTIIRFCFRVFYIYKKGLVDFFFVFCLVWKLRVKKYKGSIAIKITCILIRYYGKGRWGIKWRWKKKLVFFLWRMQRSIL
jgi:hypothetical protein